FQLAVSNAQKALILANDAGYDASAPQIRKRIELYKQGKPYLDPQFATTPHSNPTRNNHQRN
ncbi:MAG: hypothetical protein JSU94_17370, partial [Phycisphaerales bacterium]